MDSRGLLGDFERALRQFEAALGVPADSDVVKAGCIQYFEFCFELSWKTIRAVAGDLGQVCNSPKASLRQAFANEWIDDEEVWLDMLQSRNRMSHTYDAAKALEVYRRLPVFLAAMRSLAAPLQQEIDS